MDRFFKALADPTRLRILNLLRDREICVCYFVEVLGQVQPKISRHLAYLRSAGLVSARRQGKWMHYRIPEQPEPAARLLKEIFRSMDNDAAMQADHKRLARACCRPAQFVTLQHAPKPSAADLR
jgi:ArsR family transcriptional regulator